MRKLKFAAILLSVASGVGAACAQSQFPPPQPTIPAGTYNVTNYGAVGDGSTINTTAIQNAIAAAVASAAKGGTVEIPGPGTYLSGPLTMKSSVNLQVDAGATLQMLPYSGWPGITTFINGSGLHDVEISGAGVIDGQGADWWKAYNSNKISRPNFINFSSTTRILIENITLQNPPTFHLMLKGNNANITIQGITIKTPGAPGVAPNTDGMDLASTNVLIRNCSISDGDDNIEIGGSQPCAYVTVTNCSFGAGHGVSIGSITSGGVSNVLVTDCTFTNTSNGIRMKSDNDRGGIVQNLSYLNLTMTNVSYPLTIYSYYNEVGTPGNVTPLEAATEPVLSATTTTPTWRGITISNVTASGASLAGIIWGRSELPVTNVTFRDVNIAASSSFDLYNASAITFTDSQISVSPASKTFELYNAQFTLTNSAPTGSVSIDGLTTNSIGNSIALYDESALLSSTNALGIGPLSLGSCILLINGGIDLAPAAVLNYLLGTNNVEAAVSGNLALGGTVNVTAGPGFGPGTYSILNYSGALSGTFPVLGVTPAGYTYSFDTNTPGLVKLDVGPSLSPVSLALHSSASQLALSWPADHTGWRLQIQTNAHNGLGTNWTTVANSQTTNQILVPISATNGSVFLRLTYP
jgi:polygalacturonase